MNDTARGLHVVIMLCRRELVRIVRQPARLAAAIGTPALLWLLIGSGLAEAVKPEHLGEISYSGFLLPGMMSLVVVFASVFSSISLIEQRQSGWIQSVLVAPTPRWSLALGTIIGGSVVAWLQAAVLALILPFLDTSITATGLIGSLIALALTALAMTGLGLALAWRAETTTGFHAVMNLLLMPMWLLSGAFFPASAASTWIASLIRINPLTWCNEAIRNPLAGESAWTGLLVAAVFAVLAFVAATVIIARPFKR